MKLIQGDTVLRAEHAPRAAVGLDFEVPYSGDDVARFAGIAAAAVFGQHDAAVGALVGRSGEPDRDCETGERRSGGVSRLDRHRGASAGIAADAAGHLPSAPGLLAR